jgi:mono/diheme cytochrome c family protein
MRSDQVSRRESSKLFCRTLLFAIAGLVLGCGEAPAGEEPAAEGGEAVAATVAEGGTASGADAIARGRVLTVHHGCGDCHGGFQNVSGPDYLVGVKTPAQEFPIAVPPYAPTTYVTRARNLTPHEETGMGRFTERQIFNALRYGLRPGETPDVEITSTTPGQGNFPMNPKYLAPPMPWTAFRHMSDQELMDIAAYLKRGLKPVENRVADSEGPPDFWVGLYSAPIFGAYPLPPFPAAAEMATP